MRLQEFFEADNNRLSMSRLAVFMSFFPSTYVVVKTLNPDALGWFVSAYVLNYVGGKLGDALGRSQDAGNTDSADKEL